MTLTPELTRYSVTTEVSPRGAFYGEMIEAPRGEYVRFADVEAYTKAAMAAAMMEAIDELLAFRGPVDVPRTDKAIVQDDAINRCIEILKDHIPTNAMAALEAVKVQVREAIAAWHDSEALRIFDRLGDVAGVYFHRNAAASIRAMKGGAA